MTTSFFANTLTSYLEAKKLNRETVVDMFSHCGYNELAKCDLTTLSRWASGKTQPSLYKQFLVCIVLGIDLYKFIINMNHQDYSENKRDREIIDDYTSYLNNSNSNIGYFPRSDDVKVYYSLLEKQQHRDILDRYYSNFDSYISLRKKVDEAGISQPFNVFLFKENNVMCGHLSFTDKNSEYLKLFGVYREEIKHSIGINPTFYIDGKVYWMAMCCLCTYYLSNHKYQTIKFCTLSVKNRNTWEFYKSIADGETLTYFTPSANSNSFDKGFYYVKFNILRLLSKPSVIEKVQHFTKHHPPTSFLPIDDSDS
ncbi:hypothetical protein HGP28_02150 [Vibrio sp. SM6]|uniref:Uncharacterized protein n=1 Tax=Vibrio agarilyticus TaxID=2726741 RepID=A0A7X8TMX2_9VIBR|nr:hypothetical protein [Vibrio agarilyticus]NLS11691.1 hypothetical protein [Vibrio agarilyticus]